MGHYNRLDYRSEEFQKALSWATGNDEGKRFSKTNRSIEQWLWENEGLSKERVVKMFMSDFYAKQHDLKFDKDKGALSTYLLFKYRGFLFILKRGIIRIKNREYYPSQVDDEETGHNLMMEPKGQYYDGSQQEDWFILPTESGVYRQVQVRPYVPDNPERKYLKQEMLEICHDFIEEKDYPEAYWKFLYGVYDADDVAEELGITKDYVYTRMVKIREGLLARLKRKGYTSKDLYDVFRD